MLPITLLLAKRYYYVIANLCYVTHYQTVVTIARNHVITYIKLAFVTSSSNSNDKRQLVKVNLEGHSTRSTSRKKVKHKMCKVKVIQQGSPQGQAQYQDGGIRDGCPKHVP